MSMDILKREMKLNKTRNLYLFYGEEEYLKRYYTDRIVNKILEGEFSSLNKVVFEGKVSVGSLTDNCETMPVFSEKKVIIVKNSGFFKSKKGVDVNKLEELINNFPEHTCLLFCEEMVDKRLKLYKTIKQKSLIVEFGIQKPVVLVKWVKNIFKSRGKEIGTSAASWLVENSQPVMTDILNEIDKVVLYLQDKKSVLVQDLEKVCSRSIKTRIFDLTDAIGQKDSTKALKLLNDMLVMKEPLPVIIYMITRQFRHILKMKLLTGEGLTMSQAASRIGITPYAARKVNEQARNFTVDKLKLALQYCLEVDTSIKTGRMNDRIATELLIAEFSV